MFSNNLGTPENIVGLISFFTSFINLSKEEQKQISPLLIKENKVLPFSHMNEIMVKKK